MRNGGKDARDKPGLPTGKACLFLLCFVALLSVPFSAAGCGGETPARSEEERVAERALQAALSGDGTSFAALVAPSYLERAGGEMPDADRETLGDVLSSRFSQSWSFRGVKAPVFEVQEEGDKAVVHVWGEFEGAGGEPLEITRPQALRIPLIKEEGRWYLDLLDL